MEKYCCPACILLCDVEDTIADVVSRHFPVPVDQATSPSVLTHCESNQHSFTIKDNKVHMKCSKVTAVSLPTWQGALIFRQVEDFMKRASLGVVSPSAFLLTTNSAWHPSRLSATCYRWLDLLRGTSKMINLGAGCVNKAPGSCVPMKDQCYLLPPHQIKNRINPRSALEGPKNSTHVGEACQLS